MVLHNQSHAITYFFLILTRQNLKYVIKNKENSLKSIKGYVFRLSKPIKFLVQKKPFLQSKSCKKLDKYIIH